MFVVELETASLPQEWLLHSDFADFLSAFLSSPSLSAVMVCVCWIHTHTPGRSSSQPKTGTVPL